MEAQKLADSATSARCIFRRSAPTFDEAEVELYDCPGRPHVGGCNATATSSMTVDNGVRANNDQD